MNQPTWLAASTPARTTRQPCRFGSRRPSQVRVGAALGLEPTRAQAVGLRRARSGLRIAGDPSDRLASPLRALCSCSDRAHRRLMAAEAARSAEDQSQAPRWVVGPGGVHGDDCVRRAHLQRLRFHHHQVSVSRPRFLAWWNLPAFPCRCALWSAYGLPEMRRRPGGDRAPRMAFQRPRAEERARGPSLRSIMMTMVVFLRHKCLCGSPLEGYAPVEAQLPDTGSKGGKDGELGLFRIAHSIPPYRRRARWAHGQSASGKCSTDA